MLPAFFDSVLSLIVRTSTDLPPDVRAAMKVAVAEEPAATQSGQALAIIAENIDQAADCEGAICQDTGMPTFEVKTPVGANQLVLKAQIRDAIAEATRRGKLRPNSVRSRATIPARIWVPARQSSTSTNGRTTTRSR